MVDAISNRITAGLEARKNADLRVAELKVISEAIRGTASVTSEDPAVIKGITPREDMISRAMKGSEEEYQRTLRFLQSRLESEYTTGFIDPPELKNYEGAKTYAEVVVNNKVVATVDNQGAVRADDSMKGLLQGKLINDVNGTNGPDLAQARADQIAEMLGGKVARADTAITQQKFAALAPPPQRDFIVDRIGMESDPRYTDVQALIQKRAEYLGQK